jgi:hypothetical protein
MCVVASPNATNGDHERRRRGRIRPVPVNHRATDLYDPNGHPVIGGTFTTVGGSVHDGLASADPLSGKLQNCRAGCVRRRRVGRRLGCLRLFLPEQALYYLCSRAGRRPEASIGTRSGCCSQRTRPRRVRVGPRRWTGDESGAPVRYRPIHDRLIHVRLIHVRLPNQPLGRWSVRCPDMSRLRTPPLTPVATTRGSPVYALGRP